MSNNYVENKKRILEDYYLCVGAFENCKYLYNEILRLQNSCQKGSLESVILRGREADLLSNLGKVGEKALKYIISLELIRTNPNMPPSSLDDFFRKQNPIKNFATNHGIDMNDQRLVELLNYSDFNNQKAHNFDYWYSVLELTMPSVVDTFKNLIYNFMQAESIEKYCLENGHPLTYPTNYSIDNNMSFFLRLIISPNHLANVSDKILNSVGAKNNFFMNLMLKLQRENINKCGDVFTRERYASNNPDNKYFPLKKLYETISYFIFWIDLIHDNNDNLDIDLDIAFAKYQLINFQELFNLTKSDIDNIFKYYITDSCSLSNILDSRLSFNEIAKIITLGVKKDDFFDIIECSNLSSRVIQYYQSIGITDYKQMENMLEKHLNSGNMEQQTKKLIRLQ